MRLLTIIAALAFTVSASPLEKRQTPVANTVLNKITSQLGTMDTAIQKFKWKGSDQDAIDAVPILDRAGEVLKTMREGVGQIKAAPQLGLGETIAILGPLASLITAVNKVTTGLKDKKADFESAALKQVVADQLATFLAEAKIIVAQTLDKLPLPTSITGIFAQPILTTLEEALSSYGGGTAEVAPPSSAPAPAPAAPKSSAPKGKGKGKSPGRWVEDLVEFMST